MNSLQKYPYHTGYRSVIGDVLDAMSRMDMFVDRDQLNSSNYVANLPIDVYDSDDMYTVVAAIPGASSDNINIRIEDGYLYIDAELEKNYKQRFEGNIRRREIRYGTFNRKIKMPTGVSGQGVTAEYDNGLVIINVPKPEETRPYSIPIRDVSKMLEGV